MAREDKAGEARQLTEVWSLAIMFPACIGVGFAMGRGLDYLLHSYPWCTAIFTGFGVVAAFIYLFRVSGGSNDGSGSSGAAGSGSDAP